MIPVQETTPFWLIEDENELAISAVVVRLPQ